MTHEQFCYWLQGYFEISDHINLTPIQTQVIIEHLSKVFNKDDVKQITPFITGLKPVGDPKPLSGAFEKPFVHYSEHQISC